MTLAKYVAKRLLQAIPTLIGVVLFMFILIRMLPGDPARLIAGIEATEEDVERIREILGLNRPLYVQFIDYMKDVFTGDLGTSIRFGTPVIGEIMERLPYTIQLALVSEFLAVILGVPLGIMAALRPYSARGYLATVFALIGSSMPIYWMGLMFIYLFSVRLKWLPSSGADSPSSIILPALTLSLLLMGNLMRITKASFQEVLGENYITTVRAKGLSERIVIYRHALKNASVPIITIMGIQLGTLLGGAILTETVFAWPGLGTLLIDAISYRDYPLIQGIVIVFATMFVLINLIVDVIYAIIDPRVREQLWAAEE